MLRKLFKYELIDLFKKTILLFSIVVVLSLLVFLFGKLSEEYLFFSFVKDLLIIGYGISVAGILLYSVFYPLVRYYKSMLKDEAYLTQTLPVTKSQLLFTKLTCALILFLVSIFTFIGSLLLTNIILFDDLDMVISMIYPSSKIMSYIIVILYLIFYYISVIMMFITALTIGHSASTKKGSNSIVVGVVIYIIQQVLGVISLGIMFLIADDINTFLIENIFLTILIPSLTYLLLVASEIVVTHYFLKNKLNLE